MDELKNMDFNGNEQPSSNVDTFMGELLSLSNDLDQNSSTLINDLNKRIEYLTSALDKKDNACALMEEKIAFLSVQLAVSNEKVQTLENQILLSDDHLVAKQETSSSDSSQKEQQMLMNLRVKLKKMGRGLKSRISGAKIDVGQPNIEGQSAVPKTEEENDSTPIVQQSNTQVEEMEGTSLESAANVKLEAELSKLLQAIESEKTGRKSRKTILKLYKNAARLCYKLDRFEESIEHWTQAIPYTPDDASSYVERGMIYVETNQLVKAYEDAKQALELKPHSKKAISLFEKIEAKINSSFTGV